MVGRWDASQFGYLRVVDADLRCTKKVWTRDRTTVWVSPLEMPKLCLMAQVFAHAQHRFEENVFRRVVVRHHGGVVGKIESNLDIRLAPLTLEYLEIVPADVHESLIFRQIFSRASQKSRWHVTKHLLPKFPSNFTVFVHVQKWLDENVPPGVHVMRRLMFRF